LDILKCQNNLFIAKNVTKYTHHKQSKRCCNYPENKLLISKFQQLQVIKFEALRTHSGHIILTFDNFEYILTETKPE